MNTVVRLDRSTGEVFDLPQNDLRRENIELRERVARLKESLDIQLEQYRVLHARNQAEVLERNERQKEDARRAECERVFQKWKAYFSPMAREMGDKRYSAVRARLNGGFSVDDLLLAVEGAARMPADIQGSQREAMRKLEYICRHPDHVEQFMEWAGVEPEPGWVLAFRARSDTFVPSTTDVRLAHSHGTCPVCGFFAMLSPEGHWWPSTDRLWCERGCSQESMVEALLA